MISLSATIEALLFSRAEPWEIADLAKTLNLDISEVREALINLENTLQERGLVVISSGDTVTLGTHPEVHTLLEKMYKEELEKPLSKASVETLSIILYGDAITRGKIDYIRGVNSSFILRSLLVRGLIERVENPHDKKRYMYTPTLALLASLGVARREDLPDYERICAELTKNLLGSNEEESD